MPKTSLFRSITRFTRTEIVTLFKNAKPVVRSRALELRAMAQLAPSTGRILLVIPRATGTAPQRNKVRRRIKNIFFREEFFNAPIDWIIILYPPINDMSFDDLKKFLQKYMQPIKN